MKGALGSFLWGGLTGGALLAGLLWMGPKVPEPAGVQPSGGRAGVSSPLPRPETFGRVLRPGEPPPPAEAVGEEPGAVFAAARRLPALPVEVAPEDLPPPAQRFMEERPWERPSQEPERPGQEESRPLPRDVVVY